MRSHPELNVDVGVSIVDLRQLAMMRGTQITNSDRTLDNKPLYQVANEVGLWTFDELKKYFLH